VAKGIRQIEKKNAFTSLGQGESVFRLRNFNIIGFSTFILLRYMFRF
jgi:hypothetical protein